MYTTYSRMGILGGVVGVFQLTVILLSPSFNRVGGAERDIGARERERDGDGGSHQTSWPCYLYSPLM